jgi:hypothetical protein
MWKFSGDHYSPEMLIAMILSEARKITEKYAEQPVKDAVITVPSYFNQAERRAMAVAAEIAGLNLLQVGSLLTNTTLFNLINVAVLLLRFLSSALLKNANLSNCILACLP